MRYSMLLPLLFLMSCSIFKPNKGIQNVASMEDVSLVGTSWELDSIINFASEQLEQPVTMTFGNDEEHSLFGNGGCNYYNGKYTQHGSKVTFSHLLSTKKYCFVGSKTETKFTSVLLTSNKAGMDKDGRLLLMKGKEVLAVLHKTAFKGDAE